MRSYSKKLILIAALVALLSAAPVCADSSSPSLTESAVSFDWEDDSLDASSLGTDVGIIVKSGIGEEQHGALAPSEIEGASAVDPHHLPNISAEISAPDPVNAESEKGAPSVGTGIW